MKDFKTYFFDTNIFLRPLVKDHPKQTNDCVDLFSALRDAKFQAVTSQPVLAEVAWVSQSFYGFTKEEVVRAMSGLLGFKHLVISDFTNFLVALSYYKKYSLSLIDCIIGSHAIFQESDTAIVSYDKDFDKLGLRRLEPSDVLATL